MGTLNSFLKFSYSEQYINLFVETTLTAPSTQLLPASYCFVFLFRWCICSLYYCIEYAVTSRSYRQPCFRIWKPAKMACTVKRKCFMFGMARSCIVFTVTCFVFKLVLSLLLSSQRRRLCWIQSSEMCMYKTVECLILWINSESLTHRLFSLRDKVLNSPVFCRFQGEGNN